MQESRSSYCCNSKREREKEKQREEITTSDAIKAESFFFHEKAQFILLMHGLYCVHC